MADEAELRENAQQKSTLGNIQENPILESNGFSVNLPTFSRRRVTNNNNNSPETYIDKKGSANGVEIYFLRR